MKIRFWLPPNEYYRWKWYMNLAAELPAVAELLGIDVETVALIVANSLALDYNMLGIEALQDALELWIAAKDGLYSGKDVAPGTKVPRPVGPTMPNPTTLPAPVDPRIFELVISVGDSILKNRNATPKIINDLKLVPPSESDIEIPEDRRRPSHPVTDSPRVSATSSGTNVTVEITRGRNFVNTNAMVYVNRGDGDDYILLTSTVGSSVTDIVYFAAGVDRITVSYRVQLVDKHNILVGKPSEAFTLTVMRPLGM